jgi:2-keto-3-deoxy-L-fuconate dehydrogenase
MTAFRLDGKSAIVTGGGSGIGRAIATRFAEQGAHVEIVDFNVEGGQETVALIEQAGGSAGSQQCDVADQDQVQQCFDQLCEQQGKLDILVNNAAVAHVGDVLTTTGDDLDRIYRVNVKGVYHCLQAGVEKMLAHGGGAILNMASIASLVGLADRFAYSMSKGAVLTMTYSVATDYVKKNIRCNCICPARVHTPFVDGYLKQNYPGREAEMFKTLSEYQPIGRMAETDEIAALALYLCSDEASFVTGAAYPIDGGVTSIT